MIICWFIRETSSPVWDSGARTAGGFPEPNLRQRGFLRRSEQGCILFHRSWKPSQAQFEKLPKIFTTKSFFFCFSFLLISFFCCPPYLIYYSFSLSPYSPIFLTFSLFFFPSFLPSWRASQMDLKSFPPLKFYVLCNFYELKNSWSSLYYCFSKWFNTPRLSHFEIIKIKTSVTVKL